MKQAVLSKGKIISLAGTMSAVAIAALLPLIRQQAATGTLVNTVLFLSVILLGFRNALWVCFVPSVFALSSGLLPAVLAPFIPFIIFSNIILVWTFDILRKKNFWLGIISASFLKFIFILCAGRLTISFIYGQKVLQAIASMMTWPQLFTALSGGIIAYIVISSISAVNLFPSVRR